MRIYMQMPPGVDQLPRFYQLILQPDLLQGWWLVTESGAQGSSSRVRRQYFEHYDLALSAMEAQRDAQTAKGYRVMFVQGQDVPVG